MMPFWLLGQTVKRGRWTSQAEIAAAFDARLENALSKTLMLPSHRRLRRHVSALVEPALDAAMVLLRIHRHFFPLDLYLVLFDANEERSGQFSRRTHIRWWWWWKGERTWAAETKEICIEGFSQDQVSCWHVALYNEPQVGDHWAPSRRWCASVFVCTGIVQLYLRCMYGLNNVNIFPMVLPTGRSSLHRLRTTATSTTTTTTMTSKTNILSLSSTNITTRKKSWSALNLDERRS